MGILLLVYFSLLFFGVNVSASLNITKLGTYDTGLFDGSAAEVVVYDKTTGYLLVTNAEDDVVDVLEISNTSAPTKVTALNAGLSPNSVTVFNGIAAIALESDDATGNGTVAFYDLTNSSFPQLATVTVGVLPDMLTFSPDGTKVLVACEGQPNDDYDDDPEGTIYIVDAQSYETICINFQEFDGQEDDLRNKGIRIFGPNATASQDFEPEYIVVSDDGTHAVVALQENNAFAKIDLGSNIIEEIVSLGYKNHSKEENAFDASNKDDQINIKTWPTLGMYQPDGLASFVIGGKQYYASANEGDSRDYDGYSEEERVKDLSLDLDVFGDTANLQQEENLGRLKTTTANGDEDGDGIFEAIYSYGGRSFSIFDEDVEMIYDSGSMLEKILAENVPANFNSDNDENDSFDSRSDDKGPEPEGLAVGIIGEKTYLFVLLERASAIVACDISDPTQPIDFIYFDNRDFNATDAKDAGDLGPESAVFIPSSESPNGENLLVVANEVSGTTTIYKIEGDVTNTVDEEEEEEEENEEEEEEEDDEDGNIITSLVEAITGLFATVAALCI